MNGNSEAKPTFLSQGTQSLVVLSNVLKNVFLTLEKGHADGLAGNLKKFASSIDHTLQQVTGTVSIRLPPKDDLSDREAIKNKELVIKYEGFLVSTPENSINS
jgi:hypothetical protein